VYKAADTSFLSNKEVIANLRRINTNLLKEISFEQAKLAQKTIICVEDKLFFEK